MIGAMWPAIVITCAALGSVAEARPGRVVRVERRDSASAPPEYCIVTSPQSAACHGRRPTVGALLELVDDSSTWARLRVLAVAQDTGCETTWRVRTERVATNGVHERTVGLIAGDLPAEGAHRIAGDVERSAPGGRDDDRVEAAVARGDRLGALVITRYECDSDGVRAAGGPALCFDLWNGLDHSTLVDHVVSCE